MIRYDEVKNLALFLIDANRCFFSKAEKSGQAEGALYLMDYIDKVLEKLKEWARKLIEALLGPEVQPESEPIPIPVQDRERRNR
ncbi:hypothetical protein H6G20_15065 [Desertifilum sp. FACHB-1129]|uniref:Uncharacterized protein n=2 Tax=Cyanophyceae TaxID=3028117 RepID=A0A1E5QH30_9CYAN|nr:MULTISPECIES: hypothetical protein [Cyanophyceae]MCD8488221.1 hypothetical protein [Desertifilum sp.]MDA0209581.1 hypothetical protein [Cyanobacteria bacterium FC1]MBD2312991.1 hypothetical protein [Desertifilum sp. FACHB-1129]MDL5057711.1 hypothetical protein [Geitlerinema calcuttense NRMC-F 0142]OEJ73904.1 hypothetical protein BH720_17560 [Desertifilum tharense IPPAS B-1220]